MSKVTKKNKNFSRNLFIFFLFIIIASITFSVIDQKQSYRQEAQTVGCGNPADQGNEMGVGRYCTAGGGQCQGTGAAYCSADFQSGVPAFCSKPCSTDAECGTGAVCSGSGLERGCEPVACQTATTPAAGSTQPASGSGQPATGEQTTGSSSSGQPAGGIPAGGTLGGQPPATGTTPDTGLGGMLGGGGGGGGLLTMLISFLGGGGGGLPTGGGAAGGTTANCDVLDQLLSFIGLATCSGGDLPIGGLPTGGTTGAGGGGLLQTITGVFQSLF